MLHDEEVAGQILFKNTKILEEKKYVGSKKVKNIYANSSVANTHKPIIYKTNCLEKNLNDANRSFENKERSSTSITSETQVAKLLKDINMSILNVNSLRNKFEAVEELVQNRAYICFALN